MPLPRAPVRSGEGSANKLYELWDTIVRETIEHHGYSKTAAKTPGIRKGYLPYNVLAKEIVKSFDNLPLRDIPRKVRVGVVGEILVKYQPDANNHVSTSSNPRIARPWCPASWNS